jgi:NAD(P)H-flavin reductase
MAIGDIMLMEGPKGRLTYEGKGNFTIAKKQVLGRKKIGCVAGGTGITPVYQVIQASLLNKDKCQLSLVFGNRTTEDILLKQDLMDLASDFKDNFNLYLTVDIKPDEKEDWKQGVGFITKDMLKEQLPAPGVDVLILYCGPPPFEKMMRQHLEDLGYNQSM